MLEARYALYAEADDGSGAGSGATGGEDDSESDVVPKTQFIAAINSATKKGELALQALRDEFEAKLAAATKPEKTVDQPKQYTSAELNAMVEARTITQDQADAQIDFQTRKAAEEAGERKATEIVSAAQRKQHVEAAIARYKSIAPEILDDAHATRTAIKAEFAELVALGDDPRDLATQLKAIRAVLGPVDNLERSRNGKPAHESHRESGAGGGGEKRKSDDSGAVTYDSLSDREKAHYDKLIQSGLYKDKAEVNAELKHAKQHIRRKYGAMA